MKNSLNLLPTASTTRKKEQSLLIVSTSAVVILYLVFIIAIRIKTGMETRDVIREKDSLMASKTGLRSRITSAQTEAGSTKPSPLAEIAGNISAAHPWSEYLSEISRITPEKIWLSSIEIKQEQGVIMVKGYSINQIEIASLISSMERSDLFEGVEIISSQKGAKELIFELKARLTWPVKK